MEKNFWNVITKIKTRFLARVSEKLISTFLPGKGQMYTGYIRYFIQCLN